MSRLRGVLTGEQQKQAPQTQIGGGRLRGTLTQRPELEPDPTLPVLPFRTVMEREDFEFQTPTPPPPDDRGIIQKGKDLFRDVRLAGRTLKDAQIMGGQVTAGDVFKQAFKAKTYEGAVDAFIPAAKDFYKKPISVIGEGIGYAFNIGGTRDLYRQGHLDVMPAITELTTADIAKSTLAFGIEAAIYRSFPNLMQGTLAQRALLSQGITGKAAVASRTGIRAGVGALQGLGFAISEGLAKGHSSEQIIENAKQYGVAGSVLTATMPALGPLLKKEINLFRKAPESVKLAVRGLDDAAPVPLRRPEPIQDITAPGRIAAEVPTEAPARSPEARTMADVMSPDTPVTPTSAERTVPVAPRPTKPKAPATLGGKEFKPKQKFSTHYERIKNDLGGTDDSVVFETKNIRDQARKAFNYVNENPNDALKVAYGIKKAPGDLSPQAVRISMVESLKAAGRHEQARALAKRTSMEFTKSAQELNLAKLDIGSAGARKIEGVILGEKAEQIGRKLPEKIIKGRAATPKEKALAKITDDAIVASKDVNKSVIKIKSADELLRMITC